MSKKILTTPIRSEDLEDIRIGDAITLGSEKFGWDKLKAEDAAFALGQARPQDPRRSGRQGDFPRRPHHGARSDFRQRLQGRFHRSDHLHAHGKVREGIH